MIFLGYANGGSVREVFKADSIPTSASHGAVYAAVVGPFRTIRGATFMRDHGQGNPHCQCVADAERLGKLYARNVA